MGCRWPSPELGAARAEGEEVAAGLVGADPGLESWAAGGSREELLSPRRGGRVPALPPAGSSVPACLSRTERFVPGVLGLPPPGPGHCPCLAHPCGVTVCLRCGRTLCRSLLCPSQELHSAG